jgi:hypothetical protein
MSKFSFKKFTVNLCFKVSLSLVFLKHKLHIINNLIMEECFFMSLKTKLIEGNFEKIKRTIFKDKYDAIIKINNSFNLSALFKNTFLYIKLTFFVVT